MKSWISTLWLHPIAVCQITSRCGFTNLITLQLQWFCMHYYHESFPSPDKISKHRSHGDTWWKWGHHVHELLGRWGWNEYQYPPPTLGLMENKHKRNISAFFVIKILVGAWRYLCSVIFSLPLHPLVAWILSPCLCESYNVTAQHRQGAFLDTPPPTHTH